MDSRGFTSGMLLGSVVGATMGMLAGDSNMRTRRKMMKSGKNMVRKTGRLVADMVELFR